MIVSYTIGNAHNMVSTKMDNLIGINYQVQRNKLHAIEIVTSKQKKSLQFFKWHNIITRDNIILMCLASDVGNNTTQKALTKAKSKDSYFKTVERSTQEINKKNCTTDNFYISGDIFDSMIRYNNLFGKGYTMYNYFFLPLLSRKVGCSIQYDIPHNKHIVTMAIQGYVRNGAEDRYQLRYGDVWIRQDFAIGLGDKMKSRTLFMAVKYARKIFTKRPPLINQHNRLNQNYHFFIGNIGTKNERYYECEQVLKQQGKNKIPFGSIVSATAGYQIGEYLNRWYLAIDLSKGGRIDYVGHVYGQIAIGGFLRQKNIEQGTIKLHIGYFTPLLKTRWHHFRSFINLVYLTGYNRFSGELLGINKVEVPEEMNDQPKPNDPYSYLPKGTSRLSTYFTNLFFIPIIFYGFKIAFLSYIDLVTLQDPKHNELYRNSICKEVGLGLQLEREKFFFLNNLHLVIKIGYCPIIHMIAPIQLNFNINLLPDFKRRAPDIIAYH